MTRKKNQPAPTAHTPESVKRELYESNFIPNYLRQLSHPTDEQFLSDLEQDIWVIVCSLSDEKLINIYNGNLNNLRRYVAGIIHRQLKSTSSSYYRTYKRPLKYIDSTPLTLAEKEDLGVFSNADHTHDTEFIDKINVRG